jgi:hypothetical protein
MTCAGKLVVILMLCHSAGAMRSMQLRAQESSEAGTPRAMAAQGSPLVTVDFERRDFRARESPKAQSDQPNGEGVGTGQFREMHRFWDRENIWLFAGVGAARALDYTSTLNMRRRGRQEILLSNSVVDNHPLFAGIEALGTAASIGVSYWLHRTDHHRLERWVSIVHIGLASGGAVRNYALKTFHTVPEQ